MADSASAPAPAPATGRGRPASAAPGPIELADEKTVQTLATPDSFGAPLARLSPSPTGHGYGSTPPSASTARRGARNHAFFPPPTRAPRTRRPATRRRAAAAAAPSTGGREAAPPLQVSTTSLPRLMPPQNSDWSAANALGTSIWHQQHGRTLRPL